MDEPITETVEVVEQPKPKRGRPAKPKARSVAERVAHLEPIRNDLILEDVKLAYNALLAALKEAD